MPEAGRGLTAYRAALYIRLSKEDEGEGPSESVQNQEALLRTYAAQHGLTVCGAYVDATDIIGLKQNPTNGRRFSPIFVLSGHFPA